MYRVIVVYVATDCIDLCQKVVSFLNRCWIDANKLTLLTLTAVQQLAGWHPGGPCGHVHCPHHGGNTRSDWCS
jgi:hypothetical protein